MEENINKDIDITEGGKLEGMKGLGQYLTRGDTVSPFVGGSDNKKILDSLNELKDMTPSNVNPLHGYNRDVYTDLGMPDPEEFIGNEQLGKSKYDKDISYREQAYGDALNDHRANTQSAVARIGAGTLKGAITAGTTFLDGIGGTVLGLINVGVEAYKDDVDENGNPVSKEYWNAFIDNPFSNYLQSINEVSEEYIPSYETVFQQDKMWWNKLDTSHFWGESFLKNLGFTIGAYYSGGVKALGASKALKGIKGINKAERTLRGNLDKVYKIPRSVKSKTAKEATKGLVSNAEGLAKETSTLLKGIKSGQIDYVPEEIIKQLVKDAKTLKRAKWATQAMGVAAAAGSEARIEAIGAMSEFRDEGLGSLSDIKNNIYSKYSLELLDEAQEAGNVDELFVETERGFTPTEEGNAIIESRILQEFDYNQATQELEKKAVDVGNLVFGLNMAILTVSDAIQFGKYFSGDFAMKKQLKTSIKSLQPGQKVEEATGVKRRILADHLRNAVTEGAWEEMGQNMATELGKIKYGSEFNSLYDVELMVDTQADSLDWMNAVGEAFSATYGNVEAWEEGFVGALTGLIGMPRFRGAVVNKGESGSKVRSPFKFEGGIFGIRGQIQEQQDRLDANTKALQDYVNSEEFREVKSNMDIFKGIDSYMSNALDGNNKDMYDHAEMALTLNTALMYQRADMVQDLYDRLDTIDNMSIEEIRETLEDLYTDKETGKNPYSGLKDSQILEAVKSKTAKERKILDNYFKIDNALRSKFNKHIEQGLLDEGGLKELNFQLQSLEHWRDAVNEHREKIEEALFAGKTDIEDLPRSIQKISYIDDNGNIRLRDDKAPSDLMSSKYSPGFFEKNKDKIEEAQKYLNDNQSSYIKALEQLSGESSLDLQTVDALSSIVSRFEETAKTVEDILDSKGIEISDDLIDTISKYEDAVKNRDKFFDRWNSLKASPEEIYKLQEIAMEKSQEYLHKATVEASLQTMKDFKTESEFDEFIDSFKTDTDFNKKVVKDVISEAIKRGYKHASGYKGRKKLKKKLNSKKSKIKDSILSFFKGVKRKATDLRTKIVKRSDKNPIKDYLKNNDVDGMYEDGLSQSLLNKFQQFEDSIKQSLEDNIDELVEGVIDYTTTKLNEIATKAGEMFEGREFTSTKELNDAYVSHIQSLVDTLSQQEVNTTELADNFLEGSLELVIDNIIEDGEVNQDTLKISTSDLIRSVLLETLNHIKEDLVSESKVSKIKSSEVKTKKEAFNVVQDRVVDLITKLKTEELIDSDVKEVTAKEIKDQYGDKIKKSIKNLMGESTTNAQLKSIYDKIKDNVNKEISNKGKKKSPKERKELIEYLIDNYFENISVMDLLKDKILTEKESGYYYLDEKAIHKLDEEEFLHLKDGKNSDLNSLLLSEIKKDFLSKHKKHKIYANNVTLNNTLKGLIDKSLNSLYSRGNELYSKVQDSKKDITVTTELLDAIISPITISNDNKTVLEEKGKNTFLEQLEEKDTVIKRTLKEQSDALNSKLSTYVRPAMMEIDINEAVNNGNFSKYPDAKPGNNAYRDLFNYLESNGAFKYVNEGKLKEGDELILVIDKDHNKEVNDKLRQEGKSYKYNAVFIAKKNKEGTLQIVGNVVTAPNKVSEQHPSLKVAIDEIFKSSQNKEGIIEGSSTFKVKEIINGLIHLKRGEVFGQDDTILNPRDLEGMQYEVGIVKNGEVIVSDNTKFPVSYPSNISDHNGRTILFIKGPNGVGIPTILMTRNIGYNSGEKNIHNINLLDSKDIRFRKSFLYRTLKQGIKLLYEAQNNNQIMDGFDVLSQVLYFSNTKVNIREWKNGRGIFLFDGVAHDRDLQNGKNYIKTHERIQDENGETITRRVDYGDFEKSFLNALNHNEVVIQIPESMVTDNTFKQYVNAGVFTTSINRLSDGTLDTEAKSSYFTMVPKDTRTKEDVKEDKGDTDKVVTKDDLKLKPTTTNKKKDVTSNGIVLKDRGSQKKGILNSDGSIELDGKTFKLIEGDLIDESGFKVTNKMISRTLISSLKKALQSSEQLSVEQDIETKDSPNKLIESIEQEDNVDTDSSIVYGRDGFYYNTKTKVAFNSSGEMVPNFIWAMKRLDSQTDLVAKDADSMLVSFEKLSDVKYDEKTLEQEVKWLQDNIPNMDKEGAISLVEGLITVGKNKAFGTYHKGIITLSSQGVRGTAYHEAFHAIFNSSLTQEQKEELISETGITNPKKAEEWLAEKFREYMITGVQEKSWKQKVKDFFKKLLNILNFSRNNYHNYNELFRRISEGYYKKLAIESMTTPLSLKSKDRNELFNQLESIKNSTKFANLNSDIQSSLEHIGYTKETFDNMTLAEREQQLKCI